MQREVCAGTHCLSLDDCAVLSTSTDGTVRAWRTPHRGRADELFEALYERRRALRADAGSASHPSCNSILGPVSLSLSRRSLFLSIPLLSPFASEAVHASCAEEDKGENQL